MKPSRTNAAHGMSANAEPGTRRAALTNAIASIVLEGGVEELALRGLATRLNTSDRMLLYYFGSKDRLVGDALHEIGVRLNFLLAEHGGGPRRTPAQFLLDVLTLTRDPAVAPFMRLWSDVIARGARGEQPYDRIASEVVRSWLSWIEDRLIPSPAAPEPGRAAALLSIVEGVTLLEMASPGSTSEVGDYLSRALAAGHPASARRPRRPREPS
jgi:AcrR family transcriptional regulator